MSLLRRHQAPSPDRSIAGFTLIELLIVVAIIGIIAAISIPGLLRSRMSANEVAAMGGLKTICAGQTDYFNNTNPRTFSTTLTNLSSGTGAGGVGYIDTQLGSGQKSGYTFLLVSGPALGNGMVLTWSASAWPISYRSTGIRSFYIDQTGVIRGLDIGGIQGPSGMPTLDN
jgi:type IV pilus assembly protein PilA